MFDPLHKWLGVPPGEQPPHHYRLLGIEVFEDDTDVIDAAADKHLAFLHDLTNGEYAEMAERVSNQVSAARLCLLRDDKKKAYDDVLRAQLARSGSTVNPSVEPAYDVSQPGQRDAASASQVARVKNRRKSSRSRGKRPFWHYSTILCMVVLGMVGIGVKLGRITLDFSVLEPFGLVGSTQSAPDAALQEPLQPPPKRPAARQSPERSEAKNDAPPITSETSVPQPSSTANPQPSVQRSRRSLGDLVHSAPGTEDRSPIVKAPLPSESQLDEKRRLIRELYQDQYNAAQTRAEKIELAKLMHREGQMTTDDPVGRFALWRVARDILTLQGEFVAAIAIADNLDTHYLDIDSDLLKVETILHAANHIPDAYVTDFFDEAVSIATLCGDAGRFDLAKSLCAQLKQDLELRLADSKRDELDKIESDLRVVEDSFIQHQQALPTLAQAEHDPAANDTVGHYLCFMRGQWERGLPHLSRGLNQAARSAAQLELATQQEATPAIAVADAWYDVAQSESGPIAQSTIRHHALDWYRKAQSDAKGLDGRKVDSRIAELETLLPSKPDGLGIPGSSSPSNVIGYRMKTSTLSRSDVADRKGNGFTIGMGARPDGRGEALAGIELQGVQKVSIDGSASHNAMVDVDAYSKTGFVIDYHTPGGYAKRVFLGCGLAPGRKFTSEPSWGTATAPDLITDIGRAKAYEIDLNRWAPSTWDGRSWLTIYMQNSGVNRSLYATVSW